MICTISLTGTCNYKCQYCIAKKQSSHGKQYSKRGDVELFGPIIDLDAFLEFLDKYACEGSTIVLTGGEPTLVPYLRTLIKALYVKYKIIVETNGSKLFKLPILPNYDNVRLLVAWHPKMILWDKFENNINVFLHRTNFPFGNIKFIQIITYEKGNRIVQNNYPDNYSTITNDGIKPDRGYPISDEHIFIKPDGKIHLCPLCDNKEIGSIYGDFSTKNLYGYRDCLLYGGVWCNAFKNIYLAFNESSGGKCE